MKAITLVFCLVAASAWANSYKLDDPDILGKYVLHKSNKNSDVQWAEVKFNTDKQLVVVTNRNDNEYALRDTDQEDLVYEGTDEPNCDGDESSCMYDQETKIWLSKVKGAPRLTIEIATDDAFDESGKSAETDEYVLDWDKEIPDAIPFYTNMKNPKAVNALLNACKKAVSPEVRKGIWSADEICSTAHSYKYRDDFEKAWKWFLTDQVGKHNADDVKKYGEKRLAALFEKQIGQINLIPTKDLQKLTKAELIKEAKKVQSYIADNADSTYVHVIGPSASIYTINEKAKIIVKYSVNIKP